VSAVDAQMAIDLDGLFVDDRDGRDFVWLEVESAVPLAQIQEARSPDCESCLDARPQVWPAIRR
jgi:hypothetical protein